MVEQDTIRLLRECDAGIKMGISSIEDVLGHARNKGSKRTDAEGSIALSVRQQLLRHPVRVFPAGKGDLGIHPLELAETVWIQQANHIISHQKIHTAMNAFLDALDFLFHPVVFCRCLACIFQQTQTAFRQFQAGSHPVDQRAFQFRFQILQHTAQALRRNKQCFCSLAQTSLTADDLIVFQILDRHFLFSLL